MDTSELTWKAHALKKKKKKKKKLSLRGNKPSKSSSLQILKDTSASFASTGAITIASIIPESFFKKFRCVKRTQTS